MIEWKEFSPKAIDFIKNSDARLNIMYGAVRSSKTINCTVRWLEYIINGPKGSLAMFGKTMATLKRNVLNDLFDLVGAKNYHWIDRQQGELTIYDRKIYCFGANNEDAESKIRGATFAGALCDEVNLYPKSVFNQLMARLSVKGAKCFCNCNPDSPYHWFYTDYIMNDAIKNKKVWKFLLEDNLSNDEEYMESLKQMYTGVWYSRMIDGDWTAADGIVYDMFDPKKHMTKITDIIKKEDAKRYDWIVGCDYGTATVMTWGLYAKQKDRFYKVSEYYYDAEREHRQQTDLQFAKEFDRWLAYSLGVFGMTPYVVKAVYVDPSAASWKAELRQRGYPVMNADNDVINGIRTVAAKLSGGKYIMDISCESSRKEYSTYQWDPEKQKKGEDAPLKFKDHTCLSGDTKIRIHGGERAIKDLVGAEGMCESVDIESKKVVWKHFWNVHQTAECSAVYELKLRNGANVKATGDHKILTLSGMKRLDEVDREDMIGQSVDGIVTWCQVDKITMYKCEPVYDMTVDDTHTIVISNGIVVSNCDCDRYVIYTESKYGLSGVY